MGILILKRLLFACLLTVAALATARAQAGVERALPEKVGDFQGQEAARPSVAVPPVSPEDFLVVSTAGRDYVAPDGERYSVSLVKARTASAAYSLLRYFGGGGLSVPYKFRVEDRLGVTGLAGPRVKFIRGTAVVLVAGAGGPANNEAAALSFARLLADALEGEPGDVPALVLHLPEWEKKHEQMPAAGVGYAVTPAVLQSLAGPSRRPVLDVIDFDGGAEAATALYDSGRLVVVEFSTPQHSVEADAAVNRRIAELKAAGQPAPTLYRREGNYSVFVFDAPDAAAAEQLASGVKYEKDVRWLGRNPHAEEIVARRYTAKMGGVILTTLITSGLAILLCLTVGGLIGGAVFLRRRARAAEQEVYTDAGGMLRLNLEDLNTPPASVKLLRQAEE